MSLHSKGALFLPARRRAGGMVARVHSVLRYRNIRPKRLCTLIVHDARACTIIERLKLRGGQEIRIDCARSACPGSVGMCTINGVGRNVVTAAG